MHYSILPYVRSAHVILCLCSGVFGALVAGLIAGIWGVTGWGGLLYYLVMQMVVRLRLYACRIPPFRYTTAGPGS